MPRILPIVAVIAAASQAAAVEAPQEMIDYAQAQAQSWVMVPEVIAAIREQNIRTSGFDSAMIEQLDQTWRAETGSSNRPMISETLDNALSAHLRQHVDQTGGMIAEVFVMDAQGLNVGQSGVTSDYWQGDEAKFQKTYSIGPDAMHVGEIELDESTQTYSGQVSMSITDPDTGTVIGAVTIGLNADAFF